MANQLMQPSMVHATLQTPRVGLPFTQDLPETEGLDGSQPTDTRPIAVQAYARFGNYELLGEVARGGMGVVYRARDLTLGRMVALKMLRFGSSSTGEDVQRLHREAQIVAQLSHPHIIPVYEFGEYGGQFYLTMALAPGGSLSRRMEQFSGQDGAAVALVEKIARAAAYANSKGVLHRDLKPSNILLDERGEPQVSDFGIAKLMDSDVQVTQSGAVIGTPAYMAPEQAAGRIREICPATDVWSLGVMLYELLLGQRPYRGAGKEELRQAILSSNLTPPRRIRRGFDRNLETILLKCLEKNPHSRYSSALELADDLARWQRNEPILARRRSWPVLAWRRASRHPIFTSLAVAGLLIAAFLPTIAQSLDPDYELRPLQRNLAAGRSVTLVGATGTPAWSRWLLRGKAPQISTDSDGVFQLSAWDKSLLELLPDQGASFRVEAEVQHLERSGGRAGLFVGYKAVTAEGIQNHYFCQLAFTDWDPDPAPLGQSRDSSAVNLKVRRLRETLLGGSVNSYEFHTPVTGMFKVVGALPRSPARVNPQWRKLAIEARADEIEAFWDGQSLGSVPRGELQRRADRLATRPPFAAMQAPAFEGPAAVGLMVEYGVALFRNIVVKPVSEVTNP